MEYLDIVDENDNVIGKAPRNDIYAKSLTHRIVHVLVYNSKGEMLLQRRHREKDFCPNHWVTSAGGHVQSGETYEQAALREMDEEIGVTSPLTFLFKDIYERESIAKSGQYSHGRIKKYLTTFKTEHEGPFTMHPTEVDKIEFFNMNEIKNMISKGEKFHPELLFLL